MKPTHFFEHKLNLKTKLKSLIGLYLLQVLLGISLISLIPFSSFGEDSLLNKNYLGYSNAKSSYAAKTEILYHAVRSISKEIIGEIIGEEKYYKNKVLIDGNIIKHYEKYISLIQQKTPVKKEDIYHSTVKLSISISNLKAMLLKEGLLYERTEAPIFLPMVALHIEKEPPFQWWSGFSSSIGINSDFNRDEKSSRSNTKKYIHSFHSILQKSFFKKGFYIPRPHFFCFICNVPSYKNFFSSQETKYFAGLFHSDLILKGEFHFKKENKKSFYLLNWKALQAKDQKVLIRLTERKDFSQEESGKKGAEFSSFVREASDRMAERLLLLWQQGRLGIQTLELKLNYPVSIKESSKIKSLIFQMKGVKSLNEYKVSRQSISYLIYTTESAKNMARKLSFLGESYFEGKITHTENKIIVQKKI